MDASDGCPGFAVEDPGDGGRHVVAASNAHTASLANELLLARSGKAAWAGLPEFRYSTGS